MTVRSAKKNSNAKNLIILNAHDKVILAFQVLKCVDWETKAVCTMRLDNMYACLSAGQHESLTAIYKIISPLCTACTPKQTLHSQQGYNGTITVLSEVGT